MTRAVPLQRGQQRSPSEPLPLQAGQISSPVPGVPGVASSFGFLGALGGTFCCTFSRAIFCLSRLGNAHESKSKGPRVVGASKPPVSTDKRAHFAQGELDLLP